MSDQADDSIDAALAQWCQGDCALGRFEFVHAVRREPGSDLDPFEISPVEGLLVLTQTCDIVRTWRERTYVEVAPLVAVDETSLREIERMKRPRYAHVPALADRGLVVDLDRVMTVGKAVVADWSRIPGFRDDEERRRLRLALVRKRARVAFPDDFVDLARPLVSRLDQKHDKASPEGAALRALREIRVRAAPDWDAERVALFFWFIREGEGSGVPGVADLEAWLKLVPASGRFQTVEGQLATLDDLTARDFVESDPLDLDHLSSRPR